MNTARPFASLEPSFASVSALWQDLPSIWTPVGWKDHLFRFNVLWNGTILAQPHLNKRTEQWKGEGIMLSFFPVFDEQRFLSKPSWPVYFFRDDGFVRQGWLEKEIVPVLWSEWPAEGYLLRSEIFAHVPGGTETRTGIEPLYAWIRLFVHDAIRALPLEPSVGLVVRLNEPYLATSMSRGNYRVEFHPYPRSLKMESSSQNPSLRALLREPDGRIRLAVNAPPSVRVSFHPRSDQQPDDLLFVVMPGQTGASADLLLPLLPTEENIFKQELELGRNGAFREAHAFWRRRPKTAARFSVPEVPLNHCLHRSLQFAEVVAERNPADGQVSMLTGSFAYANLWATPFAMTSVMTLDAMGYHATAEKYLELFRNQQGTIKPPSDALDRHPGYLSTPSSLTSVDWLTDHGALLFAIAEHALLSGEKTFFARWQEPIVKACDFIRYARSVRGHGGVEGILPPAVGSDTQTKIQAVWNDGWNYKGLTTAVRLLLRNGHPRAQEFQQEAEDYRRTFQAAFRRRTAEMPKWKDREGRLRPFVPAALFGSQPWECRHGFHLDAGPLFLVFAGLMDAEDPLMQSALEWFRNGPPARHFRRESNCWQLPCLDYEISSCEPCYSWNVFHSHQTGDRYHFLLAMYSLFAGVFSQKTWTMCETRGGITGLTPAGIPFWLARLSVIDDQWKPNELHLLRLMPLAWCREKEPACFEQMPTEFGPITLTVKWISRRKRLDVSVRPRFRHPPARVVLHLPPLPSPFTVWLNGHPLKTGKRPSPISIDSLL